ncbi:MAG: hypothetical protein A3C38_06575 [Planctomycetes bacterium RIFCSPHIGHO2_02_FULL_50_42]|nr:MAG: hypothetical protein A3C38_06575 [Planctomycetes bacterium RIFCSPHIGHO2_02_FULL_50_42]OHB96335.1 MAG: hypothetical protein A3I59_09125 [Planctomycetes bacterium RIFCSPLOWO2_02_FULL_50_16]
MMCPVNRKPGLQVITFARFGKWVAILCKQRYFVLYSRLMEARGLAFSSDKVREHYSWGKWERKRLLRWESGADEQ